MIRIILITIILAAGALPVYFYISGYNLNNIKYIFKSKHICLGGVGIKVPRSAEIIDIYDSESNIYYYYGWWPIFKNADSTRSQVTLVENKKVITIYPVAGVDVGDGLSKSCRELKCVTKTVNLFNKSGQYYKFEVMSIFYIKDENISVILPSLDIGNLALTKIEKDCR